MAQRYLKDAEGFVYAYTELLAEQPGMKELSEREATKLAKPAKGAAQAAESVDSGGANEAGAE